MSLFLLDDGSFCTDYQLQGFEIVQTSNGWVLRYY